MLLLFCLFLSSAFSGQAQKHLFLFPFHRLVFGPNLTAGRELISPCSAIRCECLANATHHDVDDDDDDQQQKQQQQQQQVASRANGRKWKRRKARKSGAGGAQMIMRPANKCQSSLMATKMRAKREIEKN